MNILVTGANGQLGNEMRIVSRDTGDSYFFTDVRESQGVRTVMLDITDIDAVRLFVKENGIGAIVNCAAYTNVDAAESDYASAERLNADAPANLALAMSEAGGILIHISTDYVFGKEQCNVPCSEDKTGTPSGVYGLTKLHGEQRIIDSGCNYVIIRTAWLYSEFGKNFCRTILDLSARKSSLNVVFDQVGTPTYALDLANAIIKILDTLESAENPGAFSGIYNFSNEGVCSWYDFAMMTARFSGHNSCDIHPCHSSEYPSPVVRPSYSVLDKTRIKEVFGVTVPYWTDSLKLCLSRIEKKSSDNLNL